MNYTDHPQIWSFEHVIMNFAFNKDPCRPFAFTVFKTLKKVDTQLIYSHKG